MEKQSQDPEMQVLEQSPLNKVSRGPISGSKKIYIPGAIHPISVPMRQIILSDTRTAKGEVLSNQPVLVYDSSGPYTDPSISIDIYKGISGQRAAWLNEHPDIERLTGPSAAFTKSFEQTTGEVSPLQQQEALQPFFL